MSCYAIGDIQGCHVTLCRLLDRVRFDPAQDRLWLTGDLVNRGPRSLEVLRWARGLGDRVTAVLGNHDLHLVGRALGLRPPKKTDTLDPVLEAADGADLVAWLRERPLLHREGSFVLVHAGLLPEWTVGDAEALAREAEGILRGDRVKKAFAGEGGLRAVKWATSKAHEFAKPHLPVGARVATEEDATTLAELEEFLNR